MTKRTANKPGATIGLVLEGRTEYQAIPVMLRRLGIPTVAPSVFNGQPLGASVRVLVERRLLPHVRTQLLKASGVVMVVLDRETRAESAKDFEGAVHRELVGQVKRRDGESASRRVAVAVADRTFENWLLADPNGIARSKLLRRRSNLAG
jgi:hypothetical protein